MKKQFFASCIAVGLVVAGLTGCESSGPSNSMENVDADKLAEYDALIEANNAGMDEEESAPE